MFRPGSVAVAIQVWSSPLLWRPQLVEPGTIAVEISDHVAGLRGGRNQCMEFIPVVATAPLMV